MSEIAKRMAGTFVPDDTSKKPSVAEWLQKQMRTGVLKEAVRDFVNDQTELLDPAMVLVDRVTESIVYGHIPCRLADAESPRTFRFDVEFEFDPARQRFLRRN